METLLCSCPAPQLSDFLNFLRGMETFFLPVPVSLSVLFLNFLRGMETPNLPNSCFVPFLLPKLP